MAEKKAEPTSINDLLDKGWSEEEVDELKDAFVQRKDLKEREEVIEKAKKAVNESTINLLLLHGETQIKSDLGLMTFRTTTRELLDKEKLMLELVTAGVPVDTVKHCMAKATKASTSSSLEFRATKE